MASESRYWVFCKRNTIRKVTIVVPVLMTSCHESLKPKIGPVEAQAITTAMARAKVTGLPVARAVHLAKRLKNEGDLPGLIVSSRALTLEIHSDSFDSRSLRKPFMVNH